MAAQQNNPAASGPIDNAEVDEWKGRFVALLDKPAEKIQEKSPESAQGWKNSFLGCFNPLDLCLVTCCVPCLTFGKTHHRLRKGNDMNSYEHVNTSCLLLCASSCVGLHWLPIAMQRSEIRGRYNLEGSCLVDLAAACCCSCCDLIQQDKEAAEREPLNGGGVKQEYQPAQGMAYPQPAAPQQN